MDVKDVLPPDAIPSIDTPRFDTEYFGESDDEVIVLEADPPRAYPVRILHYHEIVNDDLDPDGEGDGDGDPVAVTWCPLCGSAIVYERTADGRTLTFGVSGKLADDDLVMYDRETGSEWKQTLGTCIDGPLVGHELRHRSATMTTVDSFRETYPNGLVLQPERTKSEVASDDDTPAPIDYDEEPYRRYFESEGFGLAAHRTGRSDRRWERRDIRPKEPVLGLERDGEALAFPRSVVEAEGGVTRATVGSEPVIVLATDDVLTAVHDPGFPIHRREGGFEGDGTTWDPVTGTGNDGRTLDVLPGKRMFAFAWQDDHGLGAFYRPHDTD